MPRLKSTTPGSCVGCAPEESPEGDDYEEHGCSYLLSGRVAPGQPTGLVAARGQYYTARGLAGLRSHRNESECATAPVVHTPGASVSTTSGADGHARVRIDKDPEEQ